MPIHRPPRRLSLRGPLEKSGDLSSVCLSVVAIIRAVGRFLMRREVDNGSGDTRRDGVGLCRARAKAYCSVGETHNCYGLLDVGGSGSCFVTVCRGGLCSAVDKNRPKRR
ncbi:unnamed protein product, partial [Iphiclides podalirius]